MKIRTDFVTNSSSSCFVAYRLENSEFCRYLHEQMEKNHFAFKDYSADHPASSVNFSSDSLEADISFPYGINGITDSFIDIIGDFVDLSKVDDLEKLYDAFFDDLENDRIESWNYIDNTD